jgi:hypothetical protein
MMGARASFVKCSSWPKSTLFFLESEIAPEVIEACIRHAEVHIVGRQLCCNRLINVDPRPADNDRNLGVIALEQHVATAAAGRNSCVDTLH